MPEHRDPSRSAWLAWLKPTWQAILRRDRRVAFGAGWLAVALVASWGFWQVGRAVTHPSAPPPALPEPVVGSSEVPTLVEPGLDRVTPVKISIKRIKLTAWVDQIGLTASGALEEQPFSTASHAAWYRGGPAPGEIGPAVITGHVDTKDSIAVFFYLSRLRPGDDVVITRADKSTVTFTVDWLGSFPKTEFPAGLVYGATTYPALRLITCGGTFDRTKLSYLNNIVVFAHMSDHT